MTAASEKASSGGGSELAHILDGYLAAMQAGSPPSRDQLLADHPELADDLRTCLASMEFIRRAVVEPSTIAVAGGGENHDELFARTLGDFRILREIGRGGMGVVYEAEQISLGRRVALKILPLAGMLDQKQLARFRNEAHAAAQLHHTNIVPVFSVGCERGVHYYAMQYIEGQSLAEVIAAARGSRDQGPGVRGQGNDNRAEPDQSLESEISNLSNRLLE